MNNIPEKIYLHRATKDFLYNSWSEERQSDTDIEYVLSQPVEQEESRQNVPSLQEDKINMEDKVIEEIKEYMNDLDKYFKNKK